jgi:hypothetical protein
MRGPGMMPQMMPPGTAMRGMMPPGTGAHRALALMAPERSAPPPPADTRGVPLALYSGNDAARDRYGAPRHGATSRHGWDGCHDGCAPCRQPAP